jgi:heme exporter protein CcmD
VSGKYAAFVVGAYAASAIALGWMILDTVLRARAARRALERLEKGGEG